MSHSKCHADQTLNDTSPAFAPSKPRASRTSHSSRSALTHNKTSSRGPPNNCSRPCVRPDAVEDALSHGARSRLSLPGSCAWSLPCLPRGAGEPGEEGGDDAVGVSFDPGGFG